MSEEREMFSMNKEVFYKLWTQAKENSAINGVIFFPAVNEEFARLIVKDCIEIVEPCKCGCCDGEPEGYITETIIKQIKEHFGVK